MALTFKNPAAAKAHPLFRYWSSIAANNAKFFAFPEDDQGGCNILRNNLNTVRKCADMPELYQWQVLIEEYEDDTMRVVITREATADADALLLAQGIVPTADPAPPLALLDQRAIQMASAGEMFIPQNLNLLEEVLWLKTLGESIETIKRRESHVWVPDEEIKKAEHAAFMAQGSKADARRELYLDYQGRMEAWLDYVSLKTTSTFHPLTQESLSVRPAILAAMLLIAHQRWQEGEGPLVQDVAAIEEATELRLLQAREMTEIHEGEYNIGDDNDENP